MRLRQNIGGNIVYFLNRHGGSNLRIFFGGGGFFTFCPRFAYSSCNRLLIKQVKQKEIFNTKIARSIFKSHRTFHRRNARLKLYYCLLPDPPHFSLLSTFNFIDLEIILHLILNCCKTCVC